MNREDLVLGCKVVCNGYLKKTKMKYCLPKLDIEDYEPEQLKVISNIGNSEGIKYLKLNEEFEQEQYEVVKLAKPFTGVLVGTQKVFTKKHFKCENDFVDYADNLLTQIKPYTKKEDLQFVAKVYFKKGQSRLVPLEMVELIND